MSKKLFFQIAALMLWGAVIFYVVSDKYYFTHGRKYNKATGISTDVAYVDRDVSDVLSFGGLEGQQLLNTINQLNSFREKGDGKKGSRVVPDLFPGE